MYFLMKLGKRRVAVNLHQRSCLVRFGWKVVSYSRFYGRGNRDEVSAGAM